MREETRFHYTRLIIQTKDEDNGQKDGTSMQTDKHRLDDMRKTFTPYDKIIVTQWSHELGLRASE